VSKEAMGWATGTLVVLGGVQAALINELHAGRAWQVSAGTVTLACAALAGWIASRVDNAKMVDTSASSNLTADEAAHHGQADQPTVVQQTINAKSGRIYAALIGNVVHLDAGQDSKDSERESS
jgi:hypothetical protein